MSDWSVCLANGGDRMGPEVKLHDEADGLLRLVETREDGVEETVYFSLAQFQRMSAAVARWYPRGSGTLAA